jgi:hypothetical protein
VNNLPLRSFPHKAQNGGSIRYLKTGHTDYVFSVLEEMPARRLVVERGKDDIVFYLDEKSLPPFSSLTTPPCLQPKYRHPKGNKLIVHLST